MDDQHAHELKQTERFEAALAILNGRPAGDDLVRGVELLASASAHGCGAASELLALFDAMGVARPQSWKRAFDLLQLAAEQGSRTAKGQLLLLADPMSTPDPDAWADWGAVRASVSIERLLGHAPRLNFSDTPRIRVIERLLTQAECRWLIERARLRLSPAVVLKKTGQTGVVHARSNSGVSFQIVDMDVVIEIVRNRIATASRVPVSIFEPTQILHYAVGQEFRPHFDFFDPDNPAHKEPLAGGQRIATLLIYLNNDFEGGETDFPAVGLRYRGQAGDAVFWANVDSSGRPDRLTIHAGLPPTSGEKWILSQWIRDSARPLFRAR